MGHLWLFDGIHQRRHWRARAFVGSFDKLFLHGVTSDSVAATFSNGVVIPEYVYVAFQMTFACITPALIIGAFAERVKFSALMVFMVLWVTMVYFPIAHMVWYWPGPDSLKATPHDVGYAYGLGVLDFAGGTVVHINAGIAGLMGCLVIGKRTGYGKEAMAPHSLVMTMIGASLLWVGWFGFNAGSNLESNGVTGVAFLNTFVATSAAAVSWIIVEHVMKGKPSLLGGVTGAVAGLVAVTPASGYAGPMGSIVLGLLVSPVCYFFCTTVKNRFQYDDSLDVFGVHCIGGIVGALLTGILAAPALGGQGILDYTVIPAVLPKTAYDYLGQLWIQAQGVILTLTWSSIGSTILFILVDKTMGLRPAVDGEREGSTSPSTASAPTTIEFLPKGNQLARRCKPPGLFCVPRRATFPCSSEARCACGHSCQPRCAGMRPGRSAGKSLKGPCLERTFLSGPNTLADIDAGAFQPAGQARRHP